MKIRFPKDPDSDSKFKLTLTHKELSVIENALNYSEIDLEQTEILNNNLFDKDEFLNFDEFSDFEMKIWLKINKKLKETNVY